MQWNTIFTRIMGFLVIVITLAMGSTIYDANAEIVSGNLVNLTAMSAIAGFGAFIIIFGLLVSGGMLAIAGWQSGVTASKTDMFKVIGSVIIIVLSLAMFENIITYVNTLIATAYDNDDTIGIVGFGIIPVIIYGGILAAAGWAHVSTYRKLKKGKKSTSATRSYL